MGGAAEIITRREFRTCMSCRTLTKEERVMTEHLNHVNQPPGGTDPMRP